LAPADADDADAVGAVGDMDEEAVPEQAAAMATEAARETPARSRTGVIVIRDSPCLGVV